MPTYVYPSSAEIREVEQDLLPQLTRNDPSFRILPIENANDTLLIWDQEANYTGLQQARGINAKPQVVKRLGATRYQAQPGYYGEFIDLEEEDLLRSRMYGTFNQAANIEQLVMKAHTQLLVRRLNRLSNINWTLLTTGTFAVPTKQGVLVHGDTYAFQTYSASVPWATSATATPLANFRAIQLLARGHSVDLGANAEALMNRVTFNRLTTNSNAADLAGRRSTGLQTIEGVNMINQVLLNEGLPQITIFDEGYVTEGGTFTPWIGDGVVVVVGKRASGAPIGNFRMCLNINNDPPAPGPYVKVVEDGDVPRTVAVHDGFTGGPVVYQPSAVVIMSV